jgi:hypothetical protein
VKTPILIAFFALCCFVAEAQRSPPSVLFVGNSLTYVNNVPELVQKMAASQGIELEVLAITGGGMKLEDHLRAQNVALALKRYGFAAMVLQEQSATSVVKPNSFNNAVKQLTALANTAKTQTVLFVGWARADLEAQGMTQQNWDVNAETAAVSSGAKITPVGTAWTNAVKAGVFSAQLRQADGIHAMPAGSYLAALTIYASLLNKNPAGLAAAFSVSPSATDQDLSQPVKLEPSLAKTLQSVAWKTVQAVKPQLKPTPLK